ncbi:MAG: hypothetical protein EZS28_026293 [Streblomastix strix]|uniref:Tyr recombinase domain-containing protein n=1 Tax=Streblomastix strix TaxID=222440 RepID=A0A5J4V5T1_9EUKA|nr:MAG: hypothetical protein EZS28_026293 [Streblomastix strix]
MGLIPSVFENDCFLRITEISEIDLNLSKFNFGNHAALVTLSPKTTNALEQYEVRRTGILNLCPNVTLFTWLERLKECFHQEITTLASRFWTKQWKLMSVAKISELLTLLIKKIGIGGFTAYSIKHASTTKLAELGIQERNLNIFTNHAPDSKSARNYYVFSVNKCVNGIAGRQITFDHGLENQDSTSTSVSQQKRKNEATNGDLHILLPPGGDKLKVQTSNANTTTNPCSTTSIEEWEQLRFKPSVECDRAAKQHDQVKTSKTNSFTSLHDSSQGSPQRKQEPTPGQSQMIKDQPLLLIAFRIYFLWPTPQSSRGSGGNGPSGNASQQKRKK